MRIVAIETSGSAGSVAALDDDAPLCDFVLDPRLRSARTLAPALQQLLRQVGWTPAQVELVAVAIGPGSFTGLRLGVMTAKTFAFATGAAILGVGTLDVIAAQASGAAMSVGIDAQREEVYCGRFARQPSGDVSAAEPIEIRSAARWLSGLPAAGVVTGPALEKLAEQLPPGVEAAPREAWFPSAVALGRLAALRFAGGARGDVWQLAPLYLRRSAAEEKWDARDVTAGP